MILKLYSLKKETTTIPYILWILNIMNGCVVKVKKVILI